ncbi:MAG TPA: lanthionine synthetase LanC family protein, partial [Gemmatimonadaceae bacterium]
MRIDAAASLDVAASIARHLCDTAFEYGGRHAWVGATQDADEDSGALTFACATLGPDLSRGTSGIALFLCEMWARSGDPRFRDAAEGGVRHALSRLGKVPRPVRFGFYSGHVGIAYAAARIGRLLDRADL